MINTKKEKITSTDSKEIFDDNRLYKSQESPTIITGELPETPKRPPKKQR